MALSQRCSWSPSVAVGRLTNSINCEGGSIIYQHNASKSQNCFLCCNKI